MPFAVCLCACVPVSDELTGVSHKEVMELLLLTQVRAVCWQASTGRAAVGVRSLGWRWGRRRRRLEEFAPLTLPGGMMQDARSLVRHRMHHNCTDSLANLYFFLCWLVLQYFDSVKDVANASKSSTLFMSHSPAAVSKVSWWRARGPATLPESFAACMCGQVWSQGQRTTSS